mmetsp:Transcript_12868/g.24163  ORF Transcript_12868/g.24163 Transcript_12868/m.24163 type:complete len:87 (-) Transcript_12868:835-1095(-)
MCVKVPKGGWWKTPLCKKQKKTVHVKSRSDYLKYQEVPVSPSLGHICLQKRISHLITSRLGRWDKSSLAIWRRSNILNTIKILSQE